MVIQAIKRFLIFSQSFKRNSANNSICYINVAPKLYIRVYHKYFRFLLIFTSKLISDTYQERPSITFKLLISLLYPYQFYMVVHFVSNRTPDTRIEILAIVSIKLGTKSLKILAQFAKWKEIKQYLNVLPKTCLNVLRMMTYALK